MVIKKRNNQPTLLYMCFIPAKSQCSKTDNFPQTPKEYMKDPSSCIGGAFMDIRCPPNTPYINKHSNHMQPSGHLR